VAEQHALSLQGGDGGFDLLLIGHGAIMHGPRPPLNAGGCPASDAADAVTTVHTSHIRLLPRRRAGSTPCVWRAPQTGKAMNLRVATLGFVLTAWASSSFAVTQTTYTTARFVELAAGQYQLDGFGRGINARIAPSAARALTDPVPFFDIWNIDVSAMSPGDYSFNDFLIEAQGPLEFDLVVLSSIKNGNRNTVVFDINAERTQAIGSGVFTVEADCGIDVCVWLDVAGRQERGAGGYGGNMIAVAIPEPETYALMLAGLAAVGFAARRCKPATA
ncbi:MAG TPA: FxDxF family PEP-CTERM protein, partial [Rubrivivax sp.]